MLDHPEKTARLLAALKAAVPFEVELMPSLVNYLRAQQVAIADESQHIVSDLSYAGDEGGIVCHIAPPENEEALVISLTHVRVVPHTLLRDGCARLSETPREEAEEAGPRSMINFPTVAAV